MQIDQLRSQVAAGESETQEWKRSTAELRRAGATLCAFLNGNGGRVFIGVPPNGQISGQDVADSTLRDIAETLGRFEPPARIELPRVPLANGREVIALEAPSVRDSSPFLLEGRAYKRVGSTTTAMPQAEYVPSEYSEQVGVVTVTFRGAIAEGLPRKDPGNSPEVTPEVARHVLALSEELSCKDLRAAMALKDAEHFRKNYLVPALATGLVEMTLPDVPRSSKQRYRLTASGRRWVQASEGSDREARP